MKNQPEMSRRLVILERVAGALALALFLSAGAQAQDQSQDQSQQAPPQAQSPQQPATNPPPKPIYPSQDADKPPYSKDRPLPSVPPQQNPPQEQNAPSQAAPPPQIAPGQQLPSTLTIPAGTILLIRTNDPLSSDHNQIGDQFTATLEQPVVVNGWVVARRGQVLVGQVKTAKKAGRVKGTSELDLELTDITLVDGRQMPILTELWKGSAGTSHGQDAATIGATTGLGALIGAAADWGRGAAIGAGAGAVAGIGAVLLTRGHPTELAPETPLSFRLVDPVTVDTTRTQQAFLPVSQEDFANGRGDHRRPRLAAGYPGPWYGPCGYGPCYGYPYLYPYLGFYGGYGWGPGFYGYRGYRRW
jgi:hypothetical protein